jgi:hypothetical protein
MRNIKALALLAPLLVSGCMQKRQPDRYLIPQGYTGWVLIEYEVKGAPPAGSENGFNLFRIPRNGRLQTSSPRMQTGWAKDEYYYVDTKGQRQRLNFTGWGGGGMIWGGATSDGVITVGDSKGSRQIQTPPTQTFFVGTEKQFGKAGPEPHSKQEEAILRAN